MRRKTKIILYTAVLFLLMGCQKEIGFDEGIGTASAGSLQAANTGDCLPKTLNGNFSVGKILNDSNSIAVMVNVTRAGSYIVSTDTVNGYYFRATGTFTTTGINNIILKGNGTPRSAGANKFTVSYSGTSCNIAIAVKLAGGTDWQFSVLNNATTYRGKNTEVLFIDSPTGGYSFSIRRSNSEGTDNFLFIVFDANKTFVNGETYKTDAPHGSNRAAFTYKPPNSSDNYNANDAVFVSMTFTIESHNAATKTITGSFSGTAKRLTETAIITDGSFSGTYQ